MYPLKTDIWLLLDSLTFGGIESYVLELAKGLKQQGQVAQVVLLSEHAGQDALLSKLRQHRIRFHHLHQLAKAHSSTNVFELGRQLRAAIKAHQPQVVHAHGYKASIVNKLTPHRAKTIVTYHSGETPTGRVRLYDILDRYSACFADKNLTVSPQISHKIPFASETLNNFIATDNLQTSQGKRVAFVGRLSHEKGPDRFIDVANQMSHCDFHLYGDGPMRSELSLMASSNVHFEGFTADMDSAWQEIGLLVISSRFEGLPMTAIEAMARGIPVLSTRVGAIESLIDSRVNGWVVDDYQQLADVICQWQDMDEQALMTMSQHAMNTVNDRFSSNRVVQQLLEYYAIA